MAKIAAVILSLVLSVMAMLPASAQVSGGVTSFGTINPNDIAVFKSKAQIKSIGGTPVNGQCIVYSGTYPTGSWGPAGCVAGGAGTVTSVTAIAGTGLTLTGTCTSITIFSCTFALTNTITAAGPIGDATHVPQITFNAQGQLTTVASVAITYAALGVLPCAQMPTFTGDVTNTACAMTLANTITAAGPVGDASHVAAVTFDAKGRLTTVTSVAITYAALGVVPCAQLPAFTGDVTNSLCALSIANNAVTNAKINPGATNTYKGSTNGTTTTDILITSIINSVCTLSPTICNTVFGYTNIYWYGAVCDGIFQSNQNFDQPATNISIASAATLLTSSGSTFTSADVGKRISIPFAGAAGADYSTTIASFVGATQVNVTLAASTTVTAQAATNTHPFVYGTDDTTAIQTAFVGVPFGGTIYIPGKHTGCIIRQQGANTYALLQNKPFTIRGDGRYSNLMTFPDIPSTVDNLFVDGTAGYDWTNVSWTGFSIGVSPAYIPPTFIMYRRYGKRGLVLSDSAAANFVQFNVTNLMIGESSNDHSLYIGNASSSPSQGGYIAGNKIFGGIHLANVSDSFKLVGNWLYGTSNFGGLFEFVGGAAGFYMTANNVTWTGCTIFESGTKPVVIYNYFEEVTNPSTCARNALVDWNGGIGTISGPTFVGNVVGALFSTTATPVRYSNVSGGVFGDNTITTSTARTGITSTTQLNCTAPNVWNSATPHFSTALAQTYGGC